MKFLITAGPTREAIDPVRYVSNRSSGKMGYAIAGAAARRGHEVTLVSGPCALEAPAGVNRIAVESAAQMFAEVRRSIAGVDVAVMAAAVADYRPVAAAAQKIKKSGDRLVVEMEKTPDILGSARGEMGFAGVLVGFAAETQDLEGNARDKLRRKGCDILVANDVGRSDIGFDAEENEIVVLFADGRVERPAKASKRSLAELLVASFEEAAKVRIP